MALAPLAAEADLPAGTTGDVARALRVASAAIRDAAQSVISGTDATVTVPATQGNLLRLPGPVQAVTEVTVDGTAVTDYQVFGEGLWRRCGWGTEPVPVAVTGSFGLADVPDDIIDLTVQLALAWLAHMATGGGSTAGVASARIDDAAETYTEEASGQVSPLFIPEATRTWLASRFGGGVEVVEFL